MNRFARALHGVAAAALLAAAPFDAVGRQGDLSAMTALAPDLAPALGLAAPAFVRTDGRRFAEPAQFEFYSNYSVFIDRWRLEVFRSGDEARRKPIFIVQGEGADFSKGAAWDGGVQEGPRIRPGERFAVRLSVYDRYGGSATTAEQSLLAARHAMPRVSVRLDRETTARRAALKAPPPPAADSMLKAGVGVRIRLSGVEADGAADFGPTRFEVADGEGEATAILPPGDHQFALRLGESARARLLPARVEGEAALPLPLSRALAGEETISGAIALAFSDSGEPARLLVDPVERYTVEAGAAQVAVGVWATALEPPLPPESALIARPAAKRFDDLRTGAYDLPHGDVQPDSFYLAVVDANGGRVELSQSRDYRLRPAQGRLRLTTSGRLKAAGVGAGSILEAQYRHWTRRRE